MSKTTQSPLAVADAPEQDVEEVELAGEELDAEAEAPEAQPADQGQAPAPEPAEQLADSAPEPQAAEPTPEPVAPAAGPRANVRLVIWPTLPPHFGAEIRAKRDALAAQTEEVQAAYHEAAVDRQALVDAARSDKLRAKELRAAIDRAFNSLMMAHAGRRAYCRAGRAFCDEVRDYAREQNKRDTAEVQKVRDRIDAEYTKIGRSRWHQGAVSEHRDVKAAEARARASWELLQPVLFLSGLEGGLDKRLQADLARVDKSIEQLVLEFAGWA